MLSQPVSHKPKPVSLLIKNIYVYGFGRKTPSLHEAYVTAEGRLILRDSSKGSLPLSAAYSMDAQGQYTLMPGMLDAHVHGQGGFDFADTCDSLHSIAKITAALGRTGLSYALATLVSLELPALKKALSAIHHYVEQEEKRPTPGATKIVGVHLEGPFISKACKGAHAESALQGSISLEKYKDLIAFAPSIKQWKITLDPDLPGALRFIQEVKTLEQEGIFTKVFIGHSNPKDKRTIEAAVKAGASGFTHLGNACQETCSRETHPLETKDVKSQLVKWVLENPERCPPGVELIVDGVHLSQSFVSLVKQRVGDKILLVTDALGPSGLQDGLYKLGTLAIRKEGGSFYVVDEEGRFIKKEGPSLEDPHRETRLLAGSGASLAHCAKKYAEWISGADATKEKQMHSLYTALVENPRRASLSQEASEGLPDEMNFIVLNKDQELVLSLCNGKLRSHANRTFALDFLRQDEKGLSPKLFNKAVMPDFSIINEKHFSLRRTPASKL